MKRVIKISAIALGVLVVIIVSVATYKGISPIALGLHSSVFESSGKALDGFDVVSYFNGLPVKGNEGYTFQWDGSTWLFSSQENLETFKQHPESYIPQFGGYCTKAVSTGFVAPGDPSVYSIYDDKLFIFSGEEVKEEFLLDPSKLITECEKKLN